MNIRPYRGLGIFFLILPALAFLASCEKDPDSIGLEVTPVQDQLNVHFIDTFTIEAYTVRDEKLASSYTSLNLAGAHFDPVFGRMKAGFATQLKLSSLNPSFGNNPVPDSLVLVLSFNTFYGDTNTLLTLKVFELEELLNTDSTYYSNHSVQHASRELAKHSFYPHPSDSVLVDSVKIAPQLRINLSHISHDLANKILYTPADNLADNIKFSEYLKGIYVTADPVTYGGAILYFNLLSSSTRLKLYYHNDEKDSLVYNLVINEACQRFNVYDHFNFDYANLDFRKQVVYQDTGKGNEVLYLQSMAGTRIKLRFPHFKQWREMHHVAINDAQLIVPCYESSTAYTPVTKMLAVKIKEDGLYANLPDYANGDTYFGGTYNSAKNEYRFRFTQHMQDLLAGESTDYGIYLLASAAVVRGNRVILAGPKHQGQAMKLRIVYSYLH